jgi:2-methylcitrate dehydratase
VKRFPLGQYSQTVVEAALQIRPRLRDADEIAEIRIETVTTAVRLMAGDPDKWEPTTRETADHSMPYTVAIAFLYGDVQEEHFGARFLTNAKVRALTRRVQVAASEEADRRMPQAMLCRMVVTTIAGERHEASVEYHKGHWRNPMSDAELEAKFRRLAGGVLSPPEVDRLVEALWRLDTLGDSGEIVRLTQAGAAANR